MEKGIYIIINNVNNKFYLGSTDNFHIRCLKHFNELRNNKHHNIHLQRAFNKYGEEAFEFIILQECENTKEVEQQLLDGLDLSKTYNVSSSASGGNLIANHPNREEIIKKNTLALINAPRRGPVFGEDNPNWRGGHKYFCSCGAKIQKDTKSCISCRDKSRTNNPFFGKTHTETSKQAMREAQLGVYNGNQERIVLVGELEFKSLSSCAKFYNVVPATILNRIRSKNYPDYNYK